MDADKTAGVVFAPQTISKQAIDTISEQAKNPHLGVISGLPGVDVINGGALNRHRPGDLRVVLGYTSNYKTGLMNFTARHTALAIQERGGAESKAVITVTWEQSVEEQGIIDLAQLSQIDVTRMLNGEMTNGEWSRLRKAALTRGALPWWLIGHSSSANTRRPRLTLSDVAHALEYIIDVQHVTPELIVLDYLQRMSRDDMRGDEVRVQFMAIVDRCKDMALAFNVPVLLGTQAGRQIKGRTWRLPQTDDGQETSNLEQSADSLLSVWLPKQDYPIGTLLEYGTEQYSVTPNTLMLGILKQKLGKAPKIYELHVKPEINEIYAMEKRSLVEEL